MSIRVGQAGLGEWGKNLARNFADLADLAWLSDPAEGKDAEFQGHLFLQAVPMQSVARSAREGRILNRSKRGRTYP